MLCVPVVCVADEPKTEVRPIEGRCVVVPVRRVTITSSVPGQVAEVLVSPGQRVKRGEILFRLERISQEIDVKKAEIAMRAAKVRFDQLRGGARDEMLKIARAEVAASEATLKQVEITLERLRKLRGMGTASAEEVAQAEAGVRVAQAQLVKQKAVLAAAEKTDETETARLAVDAAEMELERTRAALQSRTVLAPFDGTVLNVGVEIGSFTNPGMVGLASSSGLCDLADISAPLVDVTLPESAFAHVAVGTKCEANLIAAGKKVQGTIERISPVIDSIRNTFTVRVRLATMEVLPLGASGLVRFATKQ
jgi:multidrug resistance efflux pump